MIAKLMKGVISVEDCEADERMRIIEELKISLSIKH